jgi:starvation-inducible DNA-binding protein
MANNTNNTAEKEKGTVEKAEQPYSQLGFTKKETSELVKEMNKLLANYSVHYQKLRNFHWNVSGEDFFDLHEQFEIQYNEAKLAIDLIAEKIRVFGETPYSLMREYLEHSDIEESPTDVGAEDMVKIILDDYRTLLNQLNKVVELAVKDGDYGTDDMVKKFIKSLEKYHWMLTSFSKK